MKIRNRKPFHYNIRFKHKYKLIYQLKYNLLNIQKVYKFHYMKWRFLRAKKLRRFKKRIFTQSHMEHKSYGVSRRDPIRHPKFSYSFQSRMKLKRCLILWYRIKRIKMIGPRFFKSYRIRINNKLHFAVYNILGLIARFERRLDVIIYRFFFFSSLYFVQKLIGFKYIMINKQPISYYNVYIKHYDMIEICDNRSLFAEQLKTMLTNPYKPKFIILLQTYRYIEFNYNTLIFYYYKPFIKFSNLAGYFPFYFNYKILNSYFFQHH